MEPPGAVGPGKNSQVSHPVNGPEHHPATTRDPPFVASLAASESMVPKSKTEDYSDNW